MDHDIVRVGLDSIFFPTVAHAMYIFISSCEACVCDINNFILHIIFWQNCKRKF